jgi:hypothetical protein
LTNLSGILEYYLVQVINVLGHIDDVCTVSTNMIFLEVFGNAWVIQGCPLQNEVPDALNPLECAVQKLFPIFAGEKSISSEKE